MTKGILKGFSTCRQIKWGMLSIHLLCLLMLIPISATRAQGTEQDPGLTLGLVEGLEELDLETGDLAFFQSIKFSSVLTQIGTFSPYTHVAMIVKDEQGELFLVHATDNDYASFRMPVVGEEQARNGVILTRLEDLFNSLDGGESGFYRRIWIRKKNEAMLEVPDPKKVLELYSKYKHLPFEKSDLRFVLSAIDVFIGNFDLLAIPDNKGVMCSEFIALMFAELDLPIALEEWNREITPADIYRKIDDYYHAPYKFQFKKGKYRLIEE